MVFLVVLIPGGKRSSLCLQKLNTNPRKHRRRKWEASGDGGEKWREEMQDEN